LDLKEVRGSFEFNNEDEERGQKAAPTLNVEEQQSRVIVEVEAHTNGRTGV
jgi:hypothetical protein